MRRGFVFRVVPLLLLISAFVGASTFDETPVLAREQGAAATLRFRPVLADMPPTDSTAIGTTMPPEEAAAANAAIASCDKTVVLSLPEIPTTSRADDKAGQCIVAESRDGKQRFLLGPTALAGKGGVSGAKSRFDSGQGYVVLMDLTSKGAQQFNALAAKSYGQMSPTDQVAVVLDGVVQSNPAFQASSFSGPVQISGNFTKREAAKLAKLVSRMATSRS